MKNISWVKRNFTIGASYIIQFLAGVWLVYLGLVILLHFYNATQEEFYLGIAIYQGIVFGESHYDSETSFVQSIIMYFGAALYAASFFWTFAKLGPFKRKKKGEIHKPMWGVWILGALFPVGLALALIFVIQDNYLLYLFYRASSWAILNVFLWPHLTLILFKRGKRLRLWAQNKWPKTEEVSA